MAQSQRGKGYAKEMLGHALDILKTKQIKYVLMTCNPKNFSSQKVIKYYGGYEIEPISKRMDHLLNDTIFQLINHMHKKYSLNRRMCVVKS